MKALVATLTVSQRKFIVLLFKTLLFSQLNTVVTDLNLSDNALGTEGTIAVADMLKENCYITHLDLSDNNLSSAGAFALAEMLTTNGTITHCNFSGKIIRCVNNHEL